MRLPSRDTVIVLIFLLTAFWILISWLTGNITTENATFQNWYELIFSIGVVAFALGYFIIKRYRYPKKKRERTLVRQYARAPFPKFINKNYSSPL